MVRDRPRQASPEPPGPIELLVLQPTPFCNLDCTYCYLGDRSNRGRMSPATIEAVGRNILARASLARRLTVVWHAGEPTVLPTEWYDRAFDDLARHVPAGIRLDHAMQSNGVLIDSHWTDFLRRRNVKLGISLDGPAFLHDHNRRTRAGRCTHAKVMAGIQRLRDAGIDFHVICVLTERSLRHAEALLDFFIDNGLHDLAFNIDEIEGANRRSTCASDESGRLFSEFADLLIDRSLERRGALRIREIDALFNHILSGAPLVTDQQSRPWVIVSVDHQGNVSTFSPELLGARHPRYGGFVFGNVHREDLSVMAAGARFQRIAAEVAAGVEACRATCGYFRLCGGGAPSNKVFENGSFATTETIHCRLMRQRVADRMLSRLHALLEMPPAKDPTLVEYSVCSDRTREEAPHAD